MPYINPFGGVVTEAAIWVDPNNEIFHRKSGLAGLSFSWDNIVKAAVSLAPAVAAVAAAPFTGGTSILGWAATQSLDAAAPEMGLDARTTQNIKLGAKAAGAAYGAMDWEAAMFEDWFSGAMDSFSDFGSSVMDVAADVNWGSVAQGVMPVVSTFVNQPASRMPTYGSGVPSYPVMGSVPPAVRSAAQAIGAVGARSVVARSFFNKWPNLATAIQRMKNAGQNVTRAQLYSMLKRFGPDFLITGGILTAAGVSELMMAGAGHRRMNPGNVKALRRSMRRMESFHHLCTKADKLRRPRARVIGKKSCR